jgi:hypothetical protein
MTEQPNRQTYTYVNISSTIAERGVQNENGEFQFLSENPRSVAPMVTTANEILQNLLILVEFNGFLSNSIHEKVRGQLDSM